MLRQVACVALAVLVACRNDAPSDVRQTRAAAVPQGAEQALYRATAPEPCEGREGTARQSSGAATITIDDTTYVCRLYFRETGIVLRGDSAAGRPLPGELVARDSRGRFFSNVAGDNSRIAVWHPDGSFDRTVSHVLPGVGTMPPVPFPPIPYVDAADWVYVRWGTGIWSVYQPTLEYAGRIAVPTGEARHANAVFRGVGIIASSSARGTDRVDYFRLHGIDGVTPPFAPVPLALRDGGSFRGIVAADDTSFWAGPDPADSAGYTLERWSINGQRMGGIQRQVPWFPALGVAPPIREPGTPPRPTVNPMNVDADGRLLVYSLIVNDSFRPPGPGEQRPAVPTDRNVHLEVLDPRTGSVLASEVVSISAYALRTIPFEFFPRTRLGYRLAAPGEVRIIEYGLAGVPAR